MALISFRSYMLFLSTVNTLFAVLLTFARPQLYAAYGAPDAMPKDADTFWEWLPLPLILMSGLYCISSRVTDARFQRDICCTVATLCCAAIAVRFKFAGPLYGNAVVIPAVISDVVVFGPSFLFLFSGFGVKGKRPAVPGSLFRYSMLSAACLFLVFGVVDVFAPEKLWSLYSGGNVTTVTPEARYAMAVAGITIAIAVPGVLCNLSSTVNPVVRNNALKVCFMFVLMLIGWRVAIVKGLLFPDTLAKWKALGIPESSMWEAVYGDIFLNMTFIIPFVYYVVLGNGNAKVAIE